MNDATRHGARAPAASEPADGLVIPVDRLPVGFAARLGAGDRAIEPVPARPAATTVPLRDGEHGLEVLLVRRNRATGFVPGAYVFPGGRVDDADAAADLRARVVPLPGAAEPDLAYWVAAVRELFEETGVLLGTGSAGAPRAGDVDAWRDRLLSGRAALRDVLDALGARLDLRRLVYAAHWVTPVVEPRRYDTRFFLAEVPAGAGVSIDAREMTDAVWLTPGAALERFHAGSLPMVFPTVKTLEALAPFGSVAGAMSAFRGARVRRILPRLVRRDGGVAMVIDGDSEAAAGRVGPPASDERDHPPDSGVRESAATGKDEKP